MLQLNSSLFITALDKCKSLQQLNQIHALLTTSGLSKHDPFAWKFLSSAPATSIVHYAYTFFLQLPHPTTFHYNAVIRGFSSSKTPHKSASIFVQMLRESVVADHLTYPFLAKAAARLSDRNLGSCVHGLVLRNGFVSDMYISNSLIHFYGSCGDTVSARKMFDEMPLRNWVSWNSMLDAYAKCGDMVLMREVFDTMPTRDVVSWSSLIDGYVKLGEYVEALAVFERMGGEGPKGNEVTVVSVLCACSHLGALEQGRRMHRYIIEHSLPLTLVLATSLVDMYAKCGAIKEALEVFRGLALRKTDVLIWNAVIGGLAVHGFTDEALKVYMEMQELGIRRDEITYLCLLSACAHGGLVKEAWEYFEAIPKDGLVRKTEHYACMVDILARAGELREACRFVCEMPFEPTASMLGALLSGCINHRRFDLAEEVGKRLLELDPDHDGRYVGLSNVYAVKKRWNEARTTREAMEIRGVRKLPGFSYLEISGALHRFIAHDKTHTESGEIYSMLNAVVEQMKSKLDLENQECVPYDVDCI